MSIDLFSFRLAKSSRSAKKRDIREAFGAAPPQIRRLAEIVDYVDPGDEDFVEALEEFSDAAVNDWLRQDVVEGPPPDAYGMVLGSIARARRLIITDEEIEKLAGEVENDRRGEEEA